MVGPRPPAEYTATREGDGRACAFLVFGLFPTASYQRRTAIAYERAIGKSGRGLVDTQLQESWYVVPYVGDLLCTRVRGRVVE